MEIAEYRKGDETAILDLFKKSFKRSLSYDFWQWRFEQNPFLESPMINLMWDNSVLAGHYAVSANEMMISGKKYLASLSGTTMTNPNYEGKGIFSTLALSLYDRIAQDFNIHSVLGFPNKNSHYGLVKNIHWKDVFMIPNLFIDITRIKQNFEKADITLINKFNDDHCTFINETIQNLGFSVFVNRSQKYLNWRYINNPINNYKCVEYRVSGRLEGIIIIKGYQPLDSGENYELDILELICKQDIGVINQLLSMALKYSNHKENHLMKMNLWMSLFDARYLLLERIGFSVGMPLTYMCTKALLPGVAEVYDPRNWYISMGDSDVY